MAFITVKVKISPFFVIQLRPLHCCHIARQWEIALIRQAKEQSDSQITCEVTPHHLFLTADDARRLGPLGYMKPELGTAQDREALWANLDAIDCVASDALQQW